MCMRFLTIFGPLRAKNGQLSVLVGCKADIFGIFPKISEIFEIFENSHFRKFSKCVCSFWPPEDPRDLQAAKSAKNGPVNEVFDLVYWVHF